MSNEQETNEAERVKVGRLGPYSRRVNTIVRVVSKGEVKEVAWRSDGSIHRVSDALVGDETASVTLSLWDDDIDRVKEGDVLFVKNGYVSLFRGSMRLNIGRYGSYEVLDTPLEEVNTSNNLSEKQIIEERRSSRYGSNSGYRSRGYGRRY